MRWIWLFLVLVLPLFSHKHESKKCEKCHSNSDKFFFIVSPPGENRGIEKMEAALAQEYSRFRVVFWEDEVTEEVKAQIAKNPYRFVVYKSFAIEDLLYSIPKDDIAVMMRPELKNRWALKELNQKYQDFDLLMGKGTKHWRHVDQEALKKFQSLYVRHAPPQASDLIKIPKVVHFIWLGPRPFPPESVENVKTWMAQNPDWEFKFWTDRPRDPPCSGMETIVMTEYPFPVLGKRYANSVNWGEKSDVLRFEILYNQGGVYVDHDANCLQPFSTLHGAYDFYSCLEPPHPPVAGFNITAGNGVIGARAGHPVIKKVIDLIDERWDALGQKYPGKDGFSKTQIVMERTYLALTLALQTDLDLPGNVDIVFPAAYFFAKKGIKPLYSKHFFANSWALLDD